MTRGRIGENLDQVIDALAIIKSKATVRQGQIVRLLRVTPMQAHQILQLLRERGIIGGDPEALLRSDTRTVEQLLRREHAQETREAAPAR